MTSKDIINHNEHCLFSCWPHVKIRFPVNNKLLTLSLILRPEGAESVRQYYYIILSGSSWDITLKNSYTCTQTWYVIITHESMGFIHFTLTNRIVENTATKLFYVMLSPVENTKENQPCWCTNIMIRVTKKLYMWVLTHQ